MNIMRNKKQINQNIICIDNGRFNTKTLNIQIEYACDCSDLELINSVHSHLESVLNFSNSIFIQPGYQEPIFNPLEDSGFCQLIVVNDMDDFVAPITEVIRSNISNIDTTVKLVGLGIFVK